MTTEHALSTMPAAACSGWYRAEAPNGPAMGGAVIRSAGINRARFDPTVAA